MGATVANDIRASTRTTTTTDATTNAQGAARQGLFGLLLKSFGFGSRNGGGRGPLRLFALSEIGQSGQSGRFVGSGIAVGQGKT